MTSQAKTFVGMVVSTGTLVIAAGMVNSSWPDPARFACYVLAVIFASVFKVALPGINGTMSVNLVVVLISVVELSPAETLVLGCVAALVQTWWHKKRFEPVHVLSTPRKSPLLLSFVIWSSIIRQVCSGSRCPCG